MVLSGDNDTLVYTRNERKPRSSKREKEAGFQEQEKDKRDQGNSRTQKTSPARRIKAEIPHDTWHTVLLEGPIWQLLWWICHNAFVFARANVLQRALEVALRAVEISICFVFIGLQVGVDEFDETVQVLRSDGLVLLVEVVDIAVQDFHKELDGDSGIHAGVSHTECTLEALEDPFAVAVELRS